VSGNTHSPWLGETYILVRGMSVHLGKYYSPEILIGIASIAMKSLFLHEDTRKLGWQRPNSTTQPSEAKQIRLPL
jgi:hypothetical protein